MSEKNSALDVLSSARRFCDVVAAARQWKFPGHWSGSAFRKHPCGVIEGTVKLTNEWHVSDHCSIAITDGDGWSRNYCTDSFGHGAPHPQPVGGAAVVVWIDGRWCSDEFRAALEPRIIDMIERMQSHVEKAASEEASERAASVAEKARQRAATAASALAKATGVSA